MPNKPTEQLIEEAVGRVDDLIAKEIKRASDSELQLMGNSISMGTGRELHLRLKKLFKEELKTIATKSAEVERERILGLACDISDELTNANVPVIHPGELGEHEPDDVWEVSGNQTAHAFYGMLEQKIKGNLKCQ